MGNLTINTNGALSILLSNNIELTEEERARLSELEQQYSMLSHAEDQLKREESMVHIKLLNNPEYQAKLKLEQKIKIARDMQRKSRVLLDSAYNDIFSRQGILPSEYYSNSLPDAKPVNHGKRGRPRRLLAGASNGR